jgi:hypothetical protein
MKVSLVLTIFLLLIVAWFVVQSVLLIFQEFYKSGGDSSHKLQLPSNNDGF